MSATVLAGERSAASPRGRLAAAVLASVGIAVTSHAGALAGLLAIAALACGWAVASGVLAPRALLARFAAVNVFVAITWVTLPVSAADGVALATLITLRANAIVLSCTALLAGFDAVVLARAAAGLRLPATLCRLLFLIVRYLDLFAEERIRVERAVRARGFVPLADRRTVEVYGQLVARLLAGAIARAERVERAMRARGFGTLLAPPPVPATPRVRAREWVWAGGTACVLAAAWTYAGVA